MDTTHSHHIVSATMLLFCGAGGSGLKDAGGGRWAGSALLLGRPCLSDSGWVTALSCTVSLELLGKNLFFFYSSLLLEEAHVSHSVCGGWRTTVLLPMVSGIQLKFSDLYR